MSCCLIKPRSKISSLKGLNKINQQQNNGKYLSLPCLPALSPCDDKPIKDNEDIPKSPINEQKYNFEGKSELKNSINSIKDLDEQDNQNKVYLQSEKVIIKSELKDSQQSNQLSNSQQVINIQESNQQQQNNLDQVEIIIQDGQQEQEEQNNPQQLQNSQQQNANSNTNQSSTDTDQQNMQNSQIKDREKMAREMNLILNELSSTSFCQGIFHFKLLALAVIYFAIHRGVSKNFDLDFIAVMLFTILDIFNLFKYCIVHFRSNYLSKSLEQNIDFVDSVEFTQVYNCYQVNKYQSKYWLNWLIVHEMLTANSSIMYFFKILGSLISIVLQICALSILIQDKPKISPLTKVYFVLQISEIMMLVLIYIISVVMSIISDVYIYLVNIYKKKKAERQKHQLLNKLPRRQYKDVKQIVNDSLCSICITDFTENDQVIVLNCDNSGNQLKKIIAGEQITKNMHTFHKECINQWLEHNSSCPYCRQNIVLKNQFFKKNNNQ